MEKRLSSCESAKAVNLPLPAVFAELRGAIDDVGEAGSRSSSLRALLSHAQTLRAGSRATSELEQFIAGHGLEQFQRAEQLADMARKAGLDDDPELGSAVKDARASIEELKTQRRVIAEWTAAYGSARETILEAYRKRYVPTYKQARLNVDAARVAITESPEYARLGEKVLRVRASYMGAGCALQDIPEVSLTTEADLIAATSAFSLPLLRARIDGAALAQAEAMAMAAELASDNPTDALATWKTATLMGKTFSPSDEHQVDLVFDAAKDQVKALLRQGKTVRTL
jgi:hypothetical protein